jgi:hypothetical protein
MYPSKANHCISHLGIPVGVELSMAFLICSTNFSSPYPKRHTFKKSFTSFENPYISFTIVSCSFFESEKNSFLISLSVANITSF